MRLQHVCVFLALAGCTSPSVTGEIKNEAVCPDFELGAGQHLKGSLKRPVLVRILEDDDPRWGRVLLGKRTPEDANSKFVVEDDDEEYVVEWAQCRNEFAPKRVDFNEPDAQRGSGYQCGDAEKYGNAKLVVVEGDPASRTIEWLAPPRTDCWTSKDISMGGKPVPTASASARPEEPPKDEPEEEPEDTAPSAAPSGSAPERKDQPGPTPKAPTP